jgi:membrane-associated phospholipid phosphatase
MDAMTFVTDFADQAVALPIVMAVALILAVRGWWRGAVAWLGAIGATLGVILLLKVAFLGCEPVFAPWRLSSPSGHTATAAVVAGGLMALVTGRQLGVLLAASLAAVVIGTSRLELGFHSAAEVGIGAVVGVIGASVLCWLAGPPPARRPVSLLAVAAVVALLLHGVRLPAEDAIRRASPGLLDFVPACRDSAIK